LREESAFAQAPDAGRTLRFAFDKLKGNNGDVVHLSLTRIAPGNLPGGTSEVLLASSATADFEAGTFQTWRFFVTP
jgi:hypothetical protein